MQMYRAVEFFNIARKSFEGRISSRDLLLDVFSLKIVFL